MSATSITEIDKEEKNMEDDLSEVEVKPKEESIDMDKLAALKAKSKAKQENELASKIVSKKERSLVLGVIGSGQAGSRIAESFYKLGYNAVVLNTAMQDLKHIDVPDSNKLLLEYGVGGAAKEMEIGKAAAEAHRGEIMQLVNDKLSESQVNILCLSVKVLYHFSICLAL